MPFLVVGKSFIRTKLNIADVLSLRCTLISLSARPKKITVKSDSQISKFIVSSSVLILFVQLGLYV